MQVTGQNPMLRIWFAYANFTAHETFNATDNARCRKFLMLKIDGCQNQKTGHLEIESLVGQHQYHQLGIRIGPCSSRSPPWPSCSISPFVPSGNGKPAESAVEALCLDSQV